MIARYGFWNSRKYSLEKMTLKDLVGAYFQYYAINAYILLGIAAIFVGINSNPSLVPNIFAVSFAIVVYPLSWYVLHKFILHGKFLFRSKWTAAVWKRIHYDHHQDPFDLSVLFGALYTTLPTVALMTIPVGYLLDGIAGAAFAFASGMFTTCFYEFAHCIQHLSYKPKSKALDLMKKRHMEHHFHDEHGNYGITNFFWDHLFKTYYVRTDRPVKSTTVHNLGYTAAEAEKYPWVANLSGGLGPDDPRERRRA